MDTYNEVLSYVSDNTLRATLVASTAVLVCAYAVNQLTKKKYRLPPGPRPWPIVGNLPSLMSSPDFVQYFADLQEKHGNICTIYLGSDPYVILNGLDLIREAFVHKGNDFAGRMSSYTVDHSSRNGKSVSSGTFGPVWKVQRKIMHGAIRKFASGKHLEEKLQFAVEKMSSHLLDKSESGPVDPQLSMNLLVYNVICGVVFGTSYEANDPEFLKVIDTIDTLDDLLSAGLPADYIPILRFVPNHAQRTLHKLMPVLQGFIQKKWNEHNATYDADCVSDLVYHVIDQREELRHSGEDQSVFSQVTEEHYLELVSDFFFAATDTTRYTLAWVVYFMAAHPDIQRRMQTEIDDAVGSRPMQLSDRQHLPYTEAVVHEVMRIRPLIPMFLPHTTMCETSVGGFTLPPKTKVMANSTSLHWDPVAFPEPHVFKPDRFLDEDGKFFVRPGEWMPFSTGRRVCVGEALAKTELHLLTAMLFQRFTFSPEDGKEIDLGYQPIPMFLIPKVQMVKVTQRN